MEQTLQRIEAANLILNAFVSVRAEQAMDEAKTLAERLTSNEVIGPLIGIPIGVKDLEDVKGMVTSFGSVPYKNNVAQKDSVQVARLKAASGAVRRTDLDGDVVVAWDLNGKPLQADGKGE